MWSLEEIGEADCVPLLGGAKLAATVIKGIHMWHSIAGYDPDGPTEVCLGTGDEVENEHRGVEAEEGGVDHESEDDDFAIAPRILAISRCFSLVLPAA